MAIIPKRLKESIYADFPKDMTPNPVSGDLTRNTDVKAVKEAIRNLILTERGERLFQPSLGCGIRSMLFDLLTPSKVHTAKEMIKETIEQFEPRVVINDIDVLGRNDGDLDVIINFTVINIEKPINYTITLERAR